MKYLSFLFIFLSNSISIFGQNKVVQRCEFTNAFEFPPHKAEIEVVHTNPNTPQNEGDSLSVERDETGHENVIVEGKKMRCTFNIYTFIYVDSLKVIHIKHKRANDDPKLSKEPIYEICRYCIIGRRLIYKNNYITEEGVKLNNKLEGFSTYGIEYITKEFFDWLRNVNPMWEVINEYPSKIENDISEKDFIDVWTMGLF